MTEDHTAWHTLSLFLQQRWGPLGRRLPLGDQGDASGPVLAQVISSNPPQTKNIMFTWQFCIRLFVQYIQQFTVYLTVLCELFLQYVKWLKVFFCVGVLYSQLKSRLFAWQFCVEIYTDSKEVDSLPDSFVTSDPKVWLSCPAIQREMNRW